jgi:hypothetical protein
MRAALLAPAIVAVLATDPRAQPGTSTETQPVPMTCPAQLGTGVRTARVFCDVLIANEAAGGVILQLPKRTRDATLLFDLHTRHTYSAEQERSGSGFVRQTATVVALSLDGRLLTRAIVRAEVRRESDLFDRITGGAGPSGLKAVAPAGIETIAIDVPAGVNTVSLVGEQLVMTTLTGEEVYTTPGRPVAVVSRPVVESSRPVAAPRKSPRRR